MGRTFFLRDKPGKMLHASGMRPAPTGAERRPAVLARAYIRRATASEQQRRELSTAVKVRILCEQFMKIIEKYIFLLYYV